MGSLTLSEIKEAANDILVCVRKNSLMNERTSLENRKSVRKDSHIVSLNLVLIDGLVRSKGRLSSGLMNKCRIILPGGHHVTTLIIRFLHETNGHV